MKKLILYLLLVSGGFLFSCKDEVPDPVIPLSLSIRHEVDGNPLQPDALNFTNPAGYAYSISKLEYYISGLRLVSAAGKVVTTDGVHYVNIRNSRTNTIELAGVEPGTYSSITFNIGIGPEQNKTGALPNTLENANMAWPDPMGGGYHFLKLEGMYNAGDGSGPKGYAMHLGHNNNLVTVSLEKTLAVAKDNPSLHLVMNLNEWFRNPHTIDFEADGTQSMYNPQYMQKLVANGASVFNVN